jgi:hypothetical protein
MVGHAPLDNSFLLYNNPFVGRPLGSGKNTAMVNGRISTEQMEWLLKKAEELGGNLSAALRQAITDAQVLELARDDFDHLRLEHPEFDIPPHDDDGTARFLSAALRWRTFRDDQEEAIREAEAKGQ